MIETATLYYAWRPIFQQLLGLNAADDAQTRRRQSLRIWNEIQNMGRLGPLLEAVFPCGLADNDLTAGMSGTNAWREHPQLLAQLLARAALAAPTLVVIEDAHWQDQPPGP